MISLHINNLFFTNIKPLTTRRLHLSTGYGYDHCFKLCSVPYSDYKKGWEHVEERHTCRYFRYLSCAGHLASSSHDWKWSETVHVDMLSLINLSRRFFNQSIAKVSPHFLHNIIFNLYYLDFYIFKIHFSSPHQLTWLCLKLQIP